jgi:hypothetical protein
MHVYRGRTLSGVQLRPSCDVTKRYLRSGGWARFEAGGRAGSEYHMSHCLPSCLMGPATFKLSHLVSLCEGANTTPAASAVSLNPAWDAPCIVMHSTYVNDIAIHRVL